MFEAQRKPGSQSDIELAKLTELLNGPYQMTVMYAAPSKPRTGWLVYADGTSWNPGSGEGVYVYTSGGAWSKL